MKKQPHDKKTSKDDVRIARFLAGDLPPKAEAQLLEEAMHSPELAGDMEDLSATWQLLNDALQADANSAPPALTPERRAAILSTPIPDNTPEPIAIGPWLIGAAAAAIIAGMTLPALNQSREKARRSNSWDSARHFSLSGQHDGISGNAAPAADLRTYGSAEIEESIATTMDLSEVSSRIAPTEEAAIDKIVVAPPEKKSKSFWSRAKSAVENVTAKTEAPQASVGRTTARKSRAPQINAPAAPPSPKKTAVKPKPVLTRSDDDFSGELSDRLFKQTGNSLEKLSNGIRGADAFGAPSPSDITVTAEAELRPASGSTSNLEGLSPKQHAGNIKRNDQLLGIGSGGILIESTTGAISHRNKEVAKREGESYRDLKAKNSSGTIVATDGAAPQQELEEVMDELEADMPAEPVITTGSLTADGTGNLRTSLLDAVDLPSNEAPDTDDDGLTDADELTINAGTVTLDGNVLGGRVAGGRTPGKKAQKGNSVHFTAGANAPIELQKAENAPTSQLTADGTVTYHAIDASKLAIVDTEVATTYAIDGGDAGANLGGQAFRLNSADQPAITDDAFAADGGFGGGALITDGRNGNRQVVTVEEKRVPDDWSEPELNSKPGATTPQGGFTPDIPQFGASRSNTRTPGAAEGQKAANHEGWVNDLYVDGHVKGAKSLEDKKSGKLDNIAIDFQELGEGGGEPASVTIETKFVEVDEKDLDALGFNWLSVGQNGEGIKLGASYSDYNDNDFAGTVIDTNVDDYERVLPNKLVTTNESKVQFESGLTPEEIALDEGVRRKGRELQKEKRKAEFAQDVSPSVVDSEKHDPELDVQKKIARGRVFLENKRYGDAREEFEQILLKDPYNLAATRSLKKINDLWQVHANERRSVMRAERLAETSWKWSDPVTPLVTPTGEVAVDKAEITARNTEDIREKLDNVIIPKISFEDASLKATLKYLTQRSKDLDPDQQGVNIVIGPGLEKQLQATGDAYAAAPGDPATADDPFAAPASGEDPFAADGGGAVDPFADPGAGVGDVGGDAAVGQDIPITMDFDNIPLGEAIRYTATGAGLTYRIEGDRVIVDVASAASEADGQNSKADKKAIAAQVTKMDSIIIPRVAFKNVTLATAVKFLKQRSQDLDPDQIGINLFATAHDRHANADLLSKKISLDLRNASVAEVAQAIADEAGLVVQTDGFVCKLHPRGPLTPREISIDEVSRKEWELQAEEQFALAKEASEVGNYAAAAKNLEASRALFTDNKARFRALAPEQQKMVETRLFQLYQKLSAQAEKSNDLDAAIQFLQAAAKVAPNRANLLSPQIETLKKQQGPPPHRVAAGDTLWAIAQAHNVSVAQLKQINGLTSDVIRPGQLLALPTATVAVSNNQADDPLPPAPTQPPPPVNPFTLTAKDNLSTFALESESASWNLMRRYVNRGYLPPKGTVRMEEFVNYFDYNYTAQPEKTFTVHTAASDSAFGKNLTLLKVGVRGKVLGRDGKKPAHLIFLVDTSGSMGRADRLPLIQQGLSMCLDQLQPTDRITLVTYGSRSRLLLESVPAKQKGRVRAALGQIETGSATNMAEGIRTAYELAARHYRGGQVNRIILCSDGVANVGPAEADDLLETVKRYRQQGISFTSVGVGAGAYDDRMMEQLANQGDGQYVYIDSQAEARRTFVDNFSASLNYIARNVKIQVAFDPTVVRRYRLIGYENRNVADKDFRNDKVDAGEIGSGQSATALYEVELTTPVPQKDLGTVFVRHMEVDTEKVHEFARPITPEFVRDRTPQDAPHFHLAACAAEFAEILRGSEYCRHNLSDLEQRLIPVANVLPLDERVQEFLALVRKAQNLSEYK